MQSHKFQAGVFKTNCRTNFRKRSSKKVTIFHINNTALKILVGCKIYWYQIFLKLSCGKPHWEPSPCKMNHSHQPNTSMNVSVTASTLATALDVVESCIFVLLNIATLVGNSLVCLAFYRNPSLRTVTNYFVLLLALTDLSMALLVMPSNAVIVIRTNGITNELACEFHIFCASCLSGVSLLTVMLLAVNRYFRVVRPAIYPSIFSKKRSVAMAVCVCVVTIALVTVVGFVTRNKPQKCNTIDSVASCIQFVQTTGSSKLYFVLSNIYIVVPSLTIVACYIKIYQTIRRHNTAAAPSSQRGHSSYGVEEAKITRMLTVVVVAFYLCWLPPLISYILLALGLSEGILINYWNFFHTFPVFASGCINPMVYVTMSHSFRNKFMKILRRQR